MTFINHRCGGIKPLNNENKWSPTTVILCNLNSEIKIKIIYWNNAITDK